MLWLVMFIVVLDLCGQIYDQLIDCGTVALMVWWATKSYYQLQFHINPVQVNMAETNVTRMSSDYADNELELFRKTVS